MDGPDQIGPDLAPRRAFNDRVRDRFHRVVRKWTTKYEPFLLTRDTKGESLTSCRRDGLVGDYDYAYLFTPRLPFTKQTRKTAPFFGLDDRVPVLLAFILGLQHALAMLAGGESAPMLSLSAPCTASVVFRG